MRNFLITLAFTLMSALTLAILASHVGEPVRAQAIVGRMTPPAPDPTARPPYGIAIKRPLIAGACKGCPWGALSYVAAEAMKPYGYDVQVCWVCWSTYGPREVADKALARLRAGKIKGRKLRVTRI